MYALLCSILLYSALFHISISISIITWIFGGVRTEWALGSVVLTEVFTRLHLAGSRSSDDSLKEGPRIPGVLGVQSGFWIKIRSGNPNF